MLLGGCILLGIGNFTFIFMFNKLLRLIEQAAGLQVSIFASLQKKNCKKLYLCDQAGTGNRTYQTSLAVGTEGKAETMHFVHGWSI